MDSGSFFADHRRRLETLLHKCLPPAGEAVADAMRHAVLDGGKRLRPMLVYATGHCLNTPARQVDGLAACLELIHCYSLIHDDLPAMDNAALRRGRPSCHCQFGEDIAILAGDGLQPLAFGLLAELPDTGCPDRLRRLVGELARACGWQGMVRGQMLDVTLAGDEADWAQVEEVHRLKTGALIEAAVGMTIVQCGGEGDAKGKGEGESKGKGEGEGETARHLRRYAQFFGRAFQACDDLLDVVGNTASLGKNTGTDAGENRATAVGVLGIAGTQKHIASLCRQALAELASFGPAADHLRALVGDIHTAAADKPVPPEGTS